MSFISFLLTLHLVITAYLGWRFQWAFGAFFPAPLDRWYVYWPMILLIVAIYPLTHFYFNRHFAHIELPSWFLLTTALLFGFLAIAFTTTLMFDIVALIVRFIKAAQPVTQYIHHHRPIVGLFVLTLIVAQVVYGFYLAHTPRETYFSIHIDKPIHRENNRLRIVHLSDSHILSYTSTESYEKLVNRINALDPDLIVFTGDIVDRSIKPFIDQNFSAIFSRLRSRYGVYAVLGNHEYYGESPTLAAETFRRAGLRTMRDEVLYLEDVGVTLIGRDDRTRGSKRMALVSDQDPLTRTPRASVAELVTLADPATPLIMLDHQPFELDLAATAKIDLQFSGHTHNGQLFPFNLIVAQIFENPWGLLKKGSYHSIVSCGVGTWGPPLRLLSYSEIVVTDITFAER
ncbi:MAG: metallophosphoesterase [Burkholderiales bacterium]|jgi:predicted MPP superfamily phosphohydrolase|nr:metallophosphoesterase [Burkholderiales bacterium]